MTPWPERQRRRLNSFPADSWNVPIGSPWAYDKGFRIEGVNPSQVVKRAVESGFIHLQDRIIDLGCGKNPRNAIYLAANLGCDVEGVDLEPVEMPSGVPAWTLDHMKFHQSSVLDFDYGESVYHGAILARLVQYFSREDLEGLMSKVNKALRPEGVIALSYTADGGILNKGSEYAIQTFAYPIGEVVALLQGSGFGNITIDDGLPQSTLVPHLGEPARTYDIIAQKNATGKSF